MTYSVGIKTPEQSAAVSLFGSLNLLNCFHRLGGPILKLSLLALFIVFGFQSGAADPRLGTWTLVSAQSTLTPPDTLVITDDHGTVHVAMSGEKHIDFTAKAGGTDTAVPGNPAFDQVDLRRVNKKQAEVTEKKGGALIATIRLKISKDGKDMTISTVSAGHPDQTTVWTRTGGAKAPFDAMAGNWAEDQSKTRLAEGSVVKFEADGSGGVRFTGDSSYTARFDGKPYDVRNSRNDTVALALVDPHTVDATYRRDNQVTQKDRWTVSPDGQQMTVTRTATFETGQHLSETLVFKKQ
jgi:hypothetical protein